MTYCPLACVVCKFTGQLADLVFQMSSKSADPLPSDERKLQLEEQRRKDTGWPHAIDAGRQQHGLRAVGSMPSVLNKRQSDDSFWLSQQQVGI